MENKKLEDLLHSALTRTETPDPKLVQKIKDRLIKEEIILNKSTIRCSFRSTAVAIIALVLITTTAFAAWHFLTPSEVADQLGSPIVAEAFRSNDALLINETKSQNGYNVTFLGIVSGKGLNELDETINGEKSYAVVAIAKQQGSMPNTSDADYDSTPFFVSPLINGQKPWQYNIASMNGGYSSFVLEGIMYRLIECDTLEMFADRGLTLIVSTTSFYDINAYNYDETTGLVTPNPDFDGVNLIFDLPLNSANANFEKAQQYLDDLWDNNETKDTTDTSKETSENVKAVTIHEDAKSRLGASQTMTYEEYQVWVKHKLAETQKLVDKGEYSAASMELDRADYDSNLEKIKKGATLTMMQFTDGNYSVTITYPDTAVSASTNADGNIIIKD